MTISEEASDIPNSNDSGFGYLNSETDILGAEEDTAGSNVIAPQVPGITTDTPKVPDLPHTGAKCTCRTAGANYPGRCRG